MKYSSRTLFCLSVASIGFVSICFAQSVAKESPSATYLEIMGSGTVGFRHPEDVLFAIQKSEDEILLHFLKVKGCLSHMKQEGEGPTKEFARNCGNLEYTRSLRKNSNGFYNLVQYDYLTNGDKKVTVFKAEEPTKLQAVAQKKLSSSERLLSLSELPSEEKPTTSLFDTVGRTTVKFEHPEIVYGLQKVGAQVIPRHYFNVDGCLSLYKPSQIESSSMGEVGVVGETRPQELFDDCGTFEFHRYGLKKGDGSYDLVQDIDKSLAGKSQQVFTIALSSPLKSDMYIPLTDLDRFEEMKKDQEASPAGKRLYRIPLAPLNRSPIKN